MPKTTREYKFEPGEKLQRRWEKEYPDKRCVRVVDPERGGSYETLSKYQAMGYRTIPLTDDERVELMDGSHWLLMGCPLERWEQNKAEISARNHVPEVLS